MPILLPARDEFPLQQGDLLVDIATIVGVVGADPLGVQGTVLVVSRPCVAIRAARVVVACVVERSLQDLRKAETVGELVSFFTRLRDGDGSPDRFYLGGMEPHSPKRYFAKFDELHTVEIPVDAAARTTFLREHRTHRLSDEFIRDLQLRLFRAFASLGFDDRDWWSDEDLSLVVQRGEAILNQARAEVSKLEADRAIEEAAGGGKKVLGLTKQIEQAQNRVANVEEEVTPLRDIIERRNSSSTQEVTHPATFEPAPHRHGEGNGS